MLQTAQNLRGLCCIQNQKILLCIISPLGPTPSIWLSKGQVLHRQIAIPISFPFLAENRRPGGLLLSLIGTGKAAGDRLPLRLSSFFCKNWQRHRIWAPVLRQHRSGPLLLRKDQQVALNRVANHFQRTLHFFQRLPCNN